MSITSQPTRPPEQAPGPAPSVLETPTGAAPPRPPKREKTGPSAARRWVGIALVVLLFVVGGVTTFLAVRAESVPLLVVAGVLLLAATALAAVLATKWLPRRLYAVLVILSAVAVTVAILVPTAPAVLRCNRPSSGADLSGCDLAGADLAARDLSGADLTKADLHGATLTGADLGGADLAGADLGGANLSGAQLSEAILTSAAAVDSVFADATMVDATLGDADLGGADLSGADLGGADLNGADLREGVLDQADLTAASLDGIDGRQSSAVGTTLAGASMASAKLAGADLSTADLSGADLTAVDLTGARLSSATVENTVLVDAVMTGAHLGGASLTGADLSGADLTGADLSPADLTGATMTGANLTYVNAERTTGLTDAMLGDALGVGQADLVEAVLDARIRFESAAQISRLVAPAVTGKSVDGTHGYAPGPAFHPIVIFTGGSYAAAPWLTASGQHWTPPGLRFTELVLTVEPGQKTVESVSYFYSDGSFAHSIDRIQYTSHLTVREAATGDVVAERTLYGSMPRALETSESEYTYQVTGSKVDYEKDALPWLQELVHPLEQG